MKTNDTIHPTTGETLETQVDRYTEALLTLQPQAKHQKNELFTRLYPTIVALLSKHVSQKAILDMLQTQGLKLHPSRFKALMAAHAEAARTKVSGSIEEDAA